MRSFYTDPSIQENMEVLSASERKLIENFRDSSSEITVDNASKLRNLLASLAKGIDKVEITMEDIRKQLMKPMTPQETIDTLTKFIEGKCEGKERNKIRIIIK